MIEKMNMKSLEEQLELAIKIASEKHYGQRDKSGKPYIFHPLYIMNNVEGLDAKVVAVLHDILEDTDVTKEDLLALGFSEDIVSNIEVLTKLKKQDYMEYIENISHNLLAREVKLIDLKHNMDLTRLETINEKDLKRVEKYFKAYSILNLNSCLKEIVFLSDVLAMEYSGLREYWKVFAYISNKVHNHTEHYGPIKNVNIAKETKQIKELIDTEDLDCPESEGLYEMVVELYQKLIKANKVLDSIKNS